MNSSSRLSRESSPAPTKELSPAPTKESSPASTKESLKNLSFTSKLSSTTREVSSSKESTPPRPNIKLKRSSPVLTKKFSSPFPYTKKMETHKKTVPLSNVHTAESKQESTEPPSTKTEILYTPINKDVCSSDDELLSSDTKLNRKRPTLSKRLSTSADNVLDIQEDASPSPSPLTGGKKKATRSKSSENLSLFHGRGISIRRSGRRKNQVSNDSSKSPPNESNKLISLAQGILTNLRIPGFSRQQSGSEPPLRSSWHLKVYDGTNELETSTGSGAEVEEGSSAKVDEQISSSREKNGKMYVL